MYLNNYSVIQGWERASKRERAGEFSRVRWWVKSARKPEDRALLPQGKLSSIGYKLPFLLLCPSLASCIISLLHNCPPFLSLSLSCPSELFFLSFLSSFAPYFIHFSLQVLFFVTLTFSRLLLFSHSFRWCECIFGVLFMPFPHSCLILDPFSSSFLCLSWLMTGHYYY